MTGEYRAVILDWDDCLVQTRIPKYAQHKMVAADFYGFELPDSVMDAHWGSGLRGELPHFYGNPSATEDEIDEMVARFTATADQFPKPLQRDVEPFITEVDEANMARGIVTSHITANAISEVRAARFAGSDFRLDPKSFLFIQGSDLTPAKKPDPHVFDLALETLSTRDIGPEASVYVGDDLRDGVAAHGAGLGFIGVASGKVSVEEFRDNHFYAEPRLGRVSQAILRGTINLRPA